MSIREVDSLKSCELEREHIRVISRVIDSAKKGKGVGDSSEKRDTSHPTPLPILFYTIILVPSGKDFSLTKNIQYSIGNDDDSNFFWEACKKDLFTP